MQGMTPCFLILYEKKRTLTRNTPYVKGGCAISLTAAFNGKTYTKKGGDKAEKPMIKH
jgi:hypothetical protein